MMKKIALNLFFIVSVINVFPQNIVIQAKVDERTELISIVFRLAGADEYVNNQVADYSKDIDDYFSAFKDHEVVKYAKELRSKRGVSFDAVMSLAINVEIQSQIRFKNNLSEASLDKRWGKENADKFLVLLNRFYVETKFHEFFVNHNPLYQLAERNFTKLLKEVDLEWFQHFFGEKPNASFNLLISLTNGGSNYGPKVQFKDGKEELFAVIGTWQTDSLGQPAYTKNSITLIIHEFSHSFCNPLIDQYFKELEKQAGKFFNQSADKLRLQAYGTAKTMLYEILVRACVIKYYQRNEQTEAKFKKLVFYEKSRGFLWIEELVNSLSEYEKNRDKYPTLKAFMPEIVKLQNELTPSQLQKDWNNKCVKVVLMNIKNKSKNVDPNIKEIILTFDRPMNTGFYGSSYGQRGDKYFPDFPQNVQIKWNDSTKLEWSIPVILKPNTQYSISFPSQFFVDQNYYPLLKTYYLDFKTRKN